MDLRADDTSITKRLKPTQVVSDSMDIDQVDDPTTVLIGSNTAAMDSKGKAKICLDKKWEDQDASASDQGNSVGGGVSEDSNNHLKSSSMVSYNSTNSDMSYHDDDDDDDDDCDGYPEDDSDYGENYDDDFYQDNYSMMASQFDNVDIPPGVEASIPWLKDTAPSVSQPPTAPAPPAESSVATTSNLADNIVKSASTSTSVVPRESGSDGKVEGNEGDGVVEAWQSFKHFDVVDDFSDHRYCDVDSSGAKQPKEWAKRIQDEWKILEKDLPDTIYVRVYESRMDLLRAVLIGPAGTPYHDGLFVFDCCFPPKYPNEPPMVYYYSGGLRINPNLYNCGKVCLSLLGTWHGEQSTEMWVPGKSTMLQVLVSIQALILNDKPFFNEPGYESSYRGSQGDKRSREYNENTFVLSLKTMVYTLRRPPKYFEKFIAGHFRNRAHDIMLACQAYIEGATVGTVVIKDGAPDANKIEKRVCSNEFKGKLEKIISLMATEFVKNGSVECEQFQEKQPAVSEETT